MRRLVIALVILALLLVAAPWGIGKIAGQNVDRGLDRLVAEAPWLSIVERRYTPGWFRSSQDVTFEVLGPWFRQPPGGVETDEPQGPPSQPPSFTVRNEILHGPVLWFSGLGLARVNSRLDLPPDWRQRLIESIGTDEPLRVSTRIGFFGGRTTTFTAEKRTIEIEGGKTELSWDDFEASVSYTDDFDSFELDARWPRVASQGSDGAGGRIEGLFADGTSERIEGDLYDTDFAAGFAKLKFVDAAGKSVDMEDGEYRLTTDRDGDFLSLAARIGSGAMKGESVQVFGGAVESVHYDFTARRLHAPTLAKILRLMKESYTKPPPPGIIAETANSVPIKAQVMELFKHDPELAIDRISIATRAGEATIKGVMRARQVREEDLAAGGLGLLARLEADLKLEAPVKFLDAIQGATPWAEQLVATGLLERAGDRFVSRLEYGNGEFKINGKVQQIPGVGVGAPPPQPPVPTPAPKPEL